MEVNINNTGKAKGDVVKKTWSLPELEIISKDSVQSGSLVWYAEGAVPPYNVPNYAS